ncbi:MAG: arginine N-succinyltransferase [Phycisphaerales bacterium]|nr:arginine N-succinyltransferase [Phycisphaerales bacterium]
MFVIREACSADMPQLLRLSRLVHSFNLPQDLESLEAKVERSRRAFAGQVKEPRGREFVFVLEDVESGTVVGTSSIYSCISWPGHPHLYFKTRRREHYSKDLGTGQVHVTIQLTSDETGPSEIGGLILAPGYRGHPQKLGSLLSYVRFQFIAMHRKWFETRILAELMGALTPDSRSSLWDYLGRRFINLSYTEADTFCQRSKEFILTLFPSVEIYCSLLPPEARQLVGKVGEETIPALRMLERLGFAAQDHVDPFDGGPYLQAMRDEIPIVRHTANLRLAGPLRQGGSGARGIVSAHSALGFRAVRSEYSVTAGTLRLPERTIEILGAATGCSIGLSRFNAKGEAVAVTAARARGSAPRSRSAR